MASLPALLVTTAAAGATLLASSSDGAPPVARTTLSDTTIGVAPPSSPAATRAEPPDGSRAGAAALGSTRAAPRGRWRWPLQPRPPVARGFDAPTSTWGAGHRGIDLPTADGAVVRAVAPGTVTHVGVIAGRPTVTVTHPDGIRSTYEPVQPLARTGQVVAAGQALGTVVPDGSHCAPRSCLHLGALREDTYLDPLRLLGATRVRLLPLWG